MRARVHHAGTAEHELEVAEKKNHQINTEKKKTKRSKSDLVVEIAQLVIDLVKVGKRISGLWPEP